MPNFKDTIRQNQNKIDVLHNYLYSVVNKDLHITERKKNGLLADVKTLIGKNRTREASLSSFKDSTLDLFLKSAISFSSQKSTKKEQTKSSDIKEDKTNAFLREDKKTDKITELLKAIDKNLDAKNPSGPSSSNTKKDDDSGSGSSMLSMIAGVGGAGGALALGKKILKKKGGEVVEKVVEKSGLKAVGKIAGKFGKKIIPFAGIAFSLWGLAKHIKEGYSDYQKYDAQGNEVAKKSVLGYTLLGVTSDLLGVVGSLASSTGIGIPVALAIDAISIGLDIYSDKLKEDTIAAATSADNAIVQSSGGLILRKNNDSWEYKNGDAWAPVIDNSTGKPISVQSGNIERGEKSYTLNTINGPVDLVYDGGPKMHAKDGSNIPVNTGYPNPEAKTVNVNVNKNIVVNGGVKLDKTKKVLTNLNKSTAKALVVKEKPKTFLDGLLEGLKSFGSSVGSGVETAYNDTKKAVDNTINSAKGIIAGKGFLEMRTDDGKIIRKTGDRNWRNNNPGNVNYVKGYTANKTGVIGVDDQGFAIFDSYSNGRKALYELLFTDNNRQKYKQKNLIEAIKLYAPSAETRLGGGNNPTQYAKSLIASVGGVNKPLGDYDESSRQKIMEAIENIEGNKGGSQKIVGAYETGTNKVSKTGLALIHEGEMIIPAKNASKIRSSMASRQEIKRDSDEGLDEDFWINTFMKTLAEVVKTEYLGA